MCSSKNGTRDIKGLREALCEVLDMQRAKGPVVEKVLLSHRNGRGSEAFVTMLPAAPQ